MSDIPPPLPHNPLPSGKVVGEYRIGMPLGTGGMADVYYAIDQRLDRPVALKVLRPNLAADQTYQQRFIQEAKAAAALVHPNIVQIYNVGEDGELRYIAQEYIRERICGSTWRLRFNHRNRIELIRDEPPRL